jgi:hypothetical protein
LSAARKATELKIRCWCFQKTQIFKAHLIHAPNNEVVVNDNIELAGEPIKLIGHINIGFGGVGSPLGWLCTKMRADALSSSARLITSRG